MVHATDTDTSFWGLFSGGIRDSGLGLLVISHGGRQSASLGRGGRKEAARRGCSAVFRSEVVQMKEGPCTRVWMDLLLKFASPGDAAQWDEVPRYLVKRRGVGGGGSTDCLEVEVRVRSLPAVPGSSTQATKSWS